MNKLVSYLLRCTAISAAVAAVSCQSPEEGWSAGERGIVCSADANSHVMKVYTISDEADSLLLRSQCSFLSAAMLQSPEYSALCRGMLATVTSPEQDGVGIAGPQVGILRRIVAVQRFDKEGEPFEIYPNIRITAFSGQAVSGPEGCLSVPDCRGSVPRYQDIEITYTDPETLQDTTEHIQGFTAVIFQHECDHLDGVLYTDRMVERVF